MTTTTTTARPRIGTNIFDEDERRIEGRDKVSGRMIYTADTKRPNMLWAAYTISPYAYARIKRIDISAAKEVPGVKAILTADDIGRKRFGRQLFDWPVLCWDTVNFVGDRVVAVAAETRAAAEQAALLVEVEYEELTPMLTPAESLAPDAPALHPDWNTYHYSAFVGKPKPQLPHRNLQTQAIITKGEADLAPIFASAHKVYEHHFETPRQHCGFIEPHATLVWIDEDGTTHVQSPNKSPFALRNHLAHVAGIDPKTIVVEVTAIGGDFGGKGLTVDEFPCWFLAKATGRPVKHVQTYTEELQATNVRHPAYVTLRTAVDAHGKFIAHESLMIYNGGAYAAAKPTPTLLQGLGYGTVPYNIPNVRLDIQNAYTNTVPSGHMRAPADVQTFFAWEQHVDMIAHDLGINPLELRMLNVMRDGDTAVTAEPMSYTMGFEVLEALKREGRLDETLPPGRARGISFVCRHTGHGKADVKIRLTPSGGFDVLTGAPDQGAGNHTVFRRVAAATLSVLPERIGVKRLNTAESPADPGTGASRVTHVQGSATRIAAEKLKAELEERTGMELRDDQFVDPATGRTESIENVAREICNGEPIEVVGSFDGEHYDEHNPGDYSFSAFSFDVEVDADTGAIKIHDALIVTDVGQIISPIGHQGQIDGGFIYGIGGALMEEMPTDENGKLQTLSLGEYKMPTMMDIPPFRTVLIHMPKGKGPYGAKMAGELSNSGVAPAIVNAIYNAVGVRLSTFPITAERIFDALMEKLGGTAA